VSREEMGERGRVEVWIFDNVAGSYNENNGSNQYQLPALSTRDRNTWRVM